METAQHVTFQVVEEPCFCLQYISINCLIFQCSNYTSTSSTQQMNWQQGNEIESFIFVDSVQYMFNFSNKKA